jgi:hypothetical protein
MVDYWKLMEDPALSTIISFLIGFGLAAMFRPLCKGSDCIVLHGPPVKDIMDKVYQMGERCVEFTTEVVDCPKDKKEIVKTVEFVSTY